MSFGGQSNAPWQRNVMQGHPQSNTFHQGSQQMFMQNAQQNNMAAFGHGGMQGGGGNMFPSGGGGGGGPSVAYPQPRSGLNPVAFQQSSGQSQSHYNSIGTVTKINNDCGLVNDEVFFYRNVCKGQEPKLGDRVIFEATYANNGQFKWNATRIQLMQQQPQPLMGSSKGSYSSVAPPNEYQRSQMRHKSPKRSPIRGVGGGRNERDRRERERPHRSRDRDDEHERKRRREDRSHDKAYSVNSRGASIEGRGHAVSGGSAARSEREKERGDSRKGEREATDRDREEREKDRIRDKEIHRGAPKARRARAIKRYMVQIPKALLLHKTTNVHDLRQRYAALYIPSDFFHANIKWSDTFTPDNPFSLRRSCKFHIMHKIVESPFEQKAEYLEPADANYLYSAKVMLMALPPIAEIYKKCFETDDDDIDHHAVHPSRLINFLVGVRGRNEPMAIGGPWSSSLDGENPDKDPSVLIRTAIRTCLALTGIDLSNCTQWYRFTELYYHRTEYKNMEKNGPPRVETVVIYLPDVHSCVPSTEEWQTLSQVYKTAADDVIERRKALVDAATAAAAAANSNDDNDITDETNMTDNDATLAEDDAAENPEAEKDESAVVEASEIIEDEDENMDDSYASAFDAAAALDISGGDDADGAEEDEQTEDNAAEAAEQNVTAHDGDDNDNEKDEPAPEPTHYSLLDLKTMKVQEIRDELLARNLVDKGVRNVVMARLAKALNTEKSEETKNKSKPKFQPTPQKTPAAAKNLNVTSVGNKTKKGDEKMEVDQMTSKPEDKKTTDNKKSDKKVDLKFKKNAAKPKPKENTDKKVANKAKSDIEEQEDWADIIDFELSDIVILDEYDSSKNPEETLPKEMDEREKSQLIRRYTLPSTPQIVVHPNKSAKGGKFDCAVMSLSVLLDYHPDDTKERFFEVSLFAELFNEMLMRDFAFNIYKEVYLYEDTTTTNNTSETAEVKTEEGKKEKTESVEEVKKEHKEKDTKKEVKEKDSKKEVKEKPSKEDTKPTNANENNSISEKSSKEQHIDDTQSIKSESRKRKLSTSASTANGSGKDKESTTAVDKKLVVVKPQLLLSFVYFDTTHCGYIFEKDLEELFSLLGLNLSRSQIKKVLAKLATRQAIYYRKLTDKEESLESIPCIEDVDDLHTEELQQIADGNNQYEAVFGKKSDTNQVCAIDGEDNKDGLVNFNGAVIHVGKLVNQIKRTEKNYSDLEKLHNDLIKQHADLQKEQNKSTSKIKDIQSELKSVSRKLTDATQDLYSLNRKYRDQNSTLSYIYTRVSPYFVREKDKEKDTKTESSRDKDDKEKEKDKSKDSEKDKEKDIVKDEKEKEKIKDEKDKEKIKDEKQKETVNDDKDKDEKDKEKVKDEKEKEKVKDEKEKEKSKDDKEREKSKDDKEKEKPKADKEKEKIKNDKEKEKPKDDKEKEKIKDVKEITKDDKEKEKPKDDKEKEKLKPTKAKEHATPAKVVNKSVSTAARVVNKPLSTPAKIVNKSLPTPSKLDVKSKKPTDKVVNVSAKK